MNNKQDDPTLYHSFMLPCLGWATHFGIRNSQIAQFPFSKLLLNSILSNCNLISNWIIITSKRNCVREIPLRSGITDPCCIKNEFVRGVLLLLLLANVFVYNITAMRWCILRWSINFIHDRNYTIPNWIITNTKKCLNAKLNKSYSEHTNEN